MTEISTRPQNLVLGVSLIIAAAFTISVQDLIFKLFSSELSLWQIFALRGVFALPMLLTLCWMRGIHQNVLWAAFRKWPLLRSVFITTTFLAFYAAIPFLSLATVGAANYIAPIFVTLLSAYVIKEAVGLLGWLGVVLGFVGVVVLLQPGSDAFSAWALLPIVGAAFYALAHITTRAKCQDVPLAALSFSQNTIMLLAGVVVSILVMVFVPQGEVFDVYPYIFGGWADMKPRDWLVLVVLAGFAVFIGMMLAGAYQAAPPSTVATFEYSYLVFVVAWDILFFDTVPTATSVLGMVLIVIAGVLVLRRQ